MSYRLAKSSRQQPNIVVVYCSLGGIYSLYKESRRQCRGQSRGQCSLQSRIQTGLLTRLPMCGGVLYDLFKTLVWEQQL